MDGKSTKHGSRTKRQKKVTSIEQWPAGKRAAFRRRILQWYARHARDLPWRRTTDPYRIWVSEVMLQQTQVATVQKHYVRFVERFPTLNDLAEATQQEVLRYWQGLGYYRRAEQLWRAARVIVDQYGGVFPRSVEAMMSLPGVGRYTAGAVLSLAFDQPVAILEANTQRLYARLLGISQPLQASAVQRQLWAFAESLLPRQGAGRFHQGVMELGSEVCRRQPLCEQCPVQEFCGAWRGGLAAQIPVTAATKNYQDQVDVAVVVVAQGSPTFVLLRRYVPGERWAGLWDFPRFPWADGAPTEGPPEGSDVARRLTTLVQVRPEEIHYRCTLRHGVTRFRITLHAYLATLLRREPAQPASPFQWVPCEELDRLPVPSPTRKLCQLLSWPELGRC